MIDSLKSYLKKNRKQWPLLAALAVYVLYAHSQGVDNQTAITNYFEARNFKIIQIQDQISYSQCVKRINYFMDTHLAHKIDRVSISTGMPFGPRPLKSSDAYKATKQGQIKHVYCLAKRYRGTGRTGGRTSSSVYVEVIANTTKNNFEG